MSETETRDKGWCVLELMGHRKLAGYVTNDEGLTRIDVYLEEPSQGPPIATQWYGAAALYCITATTMDNCLALTKTHQPAPIGRWELPAPHEPEPDVADVDAVDEDPW